VMGSLTSAGRQCLACRHCSYCIRSRIRSPPLRLDNYAAQSHTPRTRCVRFVAGVTVGSRNTRFQAARYALPGPDFHRLIAPASWRTLVLVNPSYTFATPVFGGQFAVGMTGIVGRSDLNGTLTASVGPLAVMRQGSISDSVTSFGDLYPMASLRWNDGVNSWMTYITGDMPVGAYGSNDLANLGIGHGAIDGGGGYTYFNPQTGREFSVVTGLTYNLTNPSTNYQNGVDWHLDWGASQFVSEQVHIGLVGYLYDQLSCDSGSGDNVGCFQSRVAGIGPQIGFIFPVGGMQGYLNLKGYGEFDAADRPSGWSAWVTFAISPAAAAPPTTPKKPMFTK
jgi:hypothetical protein